MSVSLSVWLSLISFWYNCLYHHNIILSFISLRQLFISVQTLNAESGIPSWHYFHLFHHLSSTPLLYHLYFLQRFLLHTWLEWFYLYQWDTKCCLEWYFFGLINRSKKTKYHFYSTKWWFRSFLYPFLSLSPLILIFFHLPLSAHFFIQEKASFENEREWEKKQNLFFSISHYSHSLNPVFSSFLSFLVEIQLEKWRFTWLKEHQMKIIKMIIE